MATRRSVTRRDFVRAAALAVAAPTVISSRALGNADTPAPSERLTLGFIGIGKQSSGHLNKHSGMSASQVVAVCDVHTGRRERAKTTTEKKYERLERKATVEQYVDYHELLARKDIDAVIIGVPDHWHTSIAMDRAAMAGKDIYCEKPLTLTIHEAKTLLDTIRSTNRVFQTGSQQRSEGPFQQACEYIQNGRIGKIKEVWVGVSATSKPCDLPTEEVPAGLEWGMWLGQAPERGYNDIICRKASDPGQYPFNPGWRDYREYSGGYVTDWGAHHFDITQWALGMDHSGPVEVRPPANEGDQYGAQLVYRGSKVGDEIVVTHKNVVWEGQTKGRDGQVRQRKQTNGITFIGENGKIFVSREMIVSEPDTILAEPIHEDEIHYFKTPGHHEDWMACIKTRNRPIADVEIGARSVTVCHLVNLAYWHHRKMTWDPSKWEFPGDAEANGWRTRERRDKYQLPTATA